MLVQRGEERMDLVGCWPARKDAVKSVCVLAGTSHEFESMDPSGRKSYDRVSREYYDHYRLTNGWEICQDRY